MVPPGNVASWPMQATYAVKGDWAGLHKHNQKAAPKAAAAAKAPAGPPDDLTNYPRDWPADRNSAQRERHIDL